MYNFQLYWNDFLINLYNQQQGHISTDYHFSYNHNFYITNSIFSIVHSWYKFCCFLNSLISNVYVLSYTCLSVIPLFSFTLILFSLSLSIFLCLFLGLHFFSSPFLWNAPCPLFLLTLSSWCKSFPFLADINPVPIGKYCVHFIIVFLDVSLHIWLYQCLATTESISRFCDLASPWSSGKMPFLLMLSILMPLFLLYTL